MMINILKLVFWVEGRLSDCDVAFPVSAKVKVRGIFYKKSKTSKKVKLRKRVLSSLQRIGLKVIFKTLLSLTLLKTSTHIENILKEVKRMKWEMRAFFWLMFAALICTGTEIDLVTSNGDKGHETTVEMDAVKVALIIIVIVAFIIILILVACCCHLYRKSKSTASDEERSQQSSRRNDTEGTNDFRAANETTPLNSYSAQGQSYQGIELRHKDHLQKLTKRLKFTLVTGNQFASDCPLDENYVDLTIADSPFRVEMIENEWKDRRQDYGSTFIKYIKEQPVLQLNMLLGTNDTETDRFGTTVVVGEAGIGKSTMLEELDLRCCDLPDEGVQFLLPVLHKCKTVRLPSNAE
ncbi:hypothetical protein chiPu_0017939 [Chiloscyllium punctatum]|uniref:NACHT domain-containing protein n=1 Tax=Chiloscyllium punctatum TaxID=137246 RepID=A0A401RJX9_CHIPU|nr:hypothetical protein [Chiloscyllium punctatum]